MRKWFFLCAVAIVLLAIFALPTAVRQMPGRYRYYLPNELVAAVTTPLPAALPTAVPQTTIEPLALAVVPTQSPEQNQAATPTAVFPTSTLTAQTTASPTTPSHPTATTTAIPEPTPTIDPLPTRTQLTGLEIIPQKFNNCGPANITMSLTYFGQQADQLAIAAHVRPHYEDRNVTPAELVTYVENETTLKAVAYSGSTLRMLKELLAMGLPVVVEKGLISSEEEGWLGHYLTLSGYDEQEQVFYTLDTLLGPWEGAGSALAYDDLLLSWQHFNYTFLVVYPPSQETAVFDILTPAGPQTLWPQVMWQAAAARAQVDINTTPENPFAWFNLGTNLARLGEITGDTTYWTNAVAAFDQARTLGLPPRMLWYQFQPYEAYLQNGRYQDVLTLAETTLLSQGGRHVEETYYYQGLALQATGDLAGARLAFKRATQINPGFQKAAEALGQ